MLARIFHMLVKEFLQLRRDRYARIRLLVPPIIQMLMFGYAATFEVHQVATALIDRDNSQESRDLVSRFTANGRFEVIAIAADEKELAELIDRGRATIAIQIPPGFAAGLAQGRDGTGAAHRRRHELQHRAHRPRLREPDRHRLRERLRQRVARAHGSGAAGGDPAASRSRSAPGTTRASTVAGSSCPA